MIRTVAISVNSATIASLADSSRARGMGRTSRFRRFPHAASLEIASPAKTATANTRSSRLMTVNAATGTKKPDCVAK